MQELWHATAIVGRQCMWNKVTLLDMKNATISECFTAHVVSILIQANAVWYFWCCLGGVRGFLITAGEHGSLSLIKQSGTTNKTVVRLLPRVARATHSGHLYLPHPRASTIHPYFHCLNNRAINWRSLKETNHAIRQSIAEQSDK